MELKAICVLVVLPLFSWKLGDTLRIGLFTVQTAGGIVIMDIKASFFGNLDPVALDLTLLATVAAKESPFPLLVRNNTALLAVIFS